MSGWPESRVGQYARRVGELLGLDGDHLDMLEAAGSLHDAGKYFLSPELLEKPGPLDPAEWEAMRHHPEYGAAIARSEGHDEEVADWILHSHEALDGSGYPDALAGDAIPLGARVIAVVDAYVGMTSKRPYRDALSPEAALRELSEVSGSAYDPDVVEVFTRLVRANLPGA
ncbi:MAG TPA: HD domain-containing phosphohydrolase [Thermoleophilaceae bacterium]|nr:HD domain-containing phosphohydrolase [Thermoleophilaceae bacterium]